MNYLLKTLVLALATLAMNATYAGPDADFDFTNYTNTLKVNGVNDTNTIDLAYEMFGLTGWILSDKNDDITSGDGTISFTDAPVNGQKSGTWGIDTLAGLDNIFISLKAGNGFQAFLLDLTVANPLVGTWSSTKELSHASIYYNLSPTGPGPGPGPGPSFPEPSSIVLLTLGIAGLSMGRRYAKSKAI